MTAMQRPRPARLCHALLLASFAAALTGCGGLFFGPGGYLGSFEGAALQTQLVGGNEFRVVFVRFDNTAAFETIREAVRDNPLAFFDPGFDQGQSLFEQTVTEIAIVDPVTGAEQNRYTLTGDAAYATFKTDGEYVAWSDFSRTTDSAALQVLDVATGAQTELLIGTPNENERVFIEVADVSDGRALIQQFSAARLAPDLAVVNLQDGLLTPVDVPGYTLSILSPVLDGTRVVLIADLPSDADALLPKQQLLVLDLETGQITALATATAIDRFDLAGDIASWVTWTQPGAAADDVDPSNLAGRYTFAQRNLVSGEQTETPIAIADAYPLAVGSDGVALRIYALDNAFAPDRRPLPFTFQNAQVTTGLSFVDAAGAQTDISRTAATFADEPECGDEAAFVGDQLIYQHATCQWIARRTADAAETVLAPFAE